MVTRYLILIFILCVATKSYSQTIDSIINIKPHSTVTKDTLYQNKKYSRIYLDEKGNVIAMGNLTKDGIKNGFWVYFSLLPHRQLCIGRFKKGHRNGWWYQNFDECNIKYKKDKQVKKRCRF